MDSLTQLTLGAAVAEATIGKKVGRKASLWGALLGTFPDLDVFIPMGHAVDNFTYHRSFSHSLIVLSVVAPFFVWLICKIHPKDSKQKKRWHLTVYLVLLTHPILDSFTVYGTQLFWPITEYPVSIGSIFIVDPFYTVPLLLGVLIYLIFRSFEFSRKVNLATLLLSTIYLVWTLVAQQYFHSLAKSELEKARIEYSRLLTQPTPINTLLWRYVVMVEDGYLVGYRSLFDSATGIVFRKYESRPQLLESILDHAPVKRLQWFTHGFYSVRKEENVVVISDLRMGLEPKAYVFQFVVGDLSISGKNYQDSKQLSDESKTKYSVNPIVPYQIQSPRGLDQIKILFRRIFNSSEPIDW